MSDLASRRAISVPYAEPRRQAAAPERSSVRLVRCTLGLANRAMAVLDWCAAFAGVLVACDLAFPGKVGPGQALMLAAVGASVGGLALKLLQAHRSERYRRLGAWAADALAGGLAAGAAAGLAAWTFAPGLTVEPGRWAEGAAALLGLTVGGRAFGVWAFAGLRRRGLLRRRVAVVSADGYADPLAQSLRQGLSPLEHELVGVFEEAGDGAAREFGDLDDLRRLAQHQGVDVVVLCSLWRRPEALAGMMERLQWISADIVAPLDVPGHMRHPRLVAEIAGAPMVQLVHHPLKGAEGLAKVVEDYVVATLALLLASPVMIAAAVAIGLTSPGPVLFRQTRMGLNGRLFEIYKFRTMRVDPGDDGSAQAVKGDTRITPVGALLRRTSIDELPQLFNVLKGEMSVVGPRPHVPGIVIGDTPYSEVVRSYAARHRIKPGLTGWAQINGARGGIHTPDKARAAVEADLHYIQRWSLRFDLEIMLKTFGHLIGNPTVF